MKRSVPFLAAGLLLAAVAAGWFLLRDTEDARIRKTAERLCRIAAFREKENPALAALRLRELEEVFCDPVLLEFRHRHWEDRPVRIRELSARLAAAYRLLRFLELKIGDFHVQRQGDQAELSFSAELKGRARSGHEDFLEIRDVSALLVRRDGVWKFREIRAREVLER